MMKRMKFCSLLLALSFVLALCPMLMTPAMAQEEAQASSDVWKGETATKFDGGNGYDTPFLMSSAAHFALLQKVFNIPYTVDGEVKSLPSAVNNKGDDFFFDNDGALQWAFVNDGGNTYFYRAGENVAYLVTKSDESTPVYVYNIDGEFYYTFEQCTNSSGTTLYPAYTYSPSGFEFLDRYIILSRSGYCSLGYFDANNKAKKTSSEISISAVKQNSYSTGTYVDVNGETQEIVYFTGANSHVYQELYRYTDQAANNYILLHEDAALTKYAYTYSVDENGNISITFDLNAPRTFYSYAAATYQLTQDIRFNDVSNYANWSTAKPANAGKFSPLGNGKYPFSGTLDGAGHTIEGMYLYGTNYTAPFGHAKNATFKNLNIAKSFVVGAFYSSLLVGNIAGDLTIENCNVEGYLTVSSYASAMLVGNGSANALIKNVTISGNAVYTKNSNPFGAFMGSVGGTALLVNCANYANIESTQVNGSIAGFIGNCLGDKTLINCHNFGDLTVAGGGTSGGFVANIDAGSLYLYNCTNYGDVKIAGAGATGVVGGLIGNVGRNNTNCYIYNSANYGDVSAQNGLAGGIVGVTTANTPRAGLVVKNCLQAGTVTSAQENGAGLLLGGINNKSPNLSYSKQFTDNFYVAQGDLDLPLLADDTNFNASYDKFENNIAVTDAAAAVEALNANATAGTLPAVPNGSYNPWYVSSETGKALPALNDAQIGASLAMGSQLALNFYVKCNPLTQYRGAVFTYGTHELTYKGQVKIDGDHYQHYVVGGIHPSKLNETAEAQLAEKNGTALASITYDVATYAQRKYGEAGEELKGLLYALAAYGEAAGSVGTFEAVTGLAYSADLVKADFDTLKENGLYPAPTGTSSSAIQMSLSIGTESVVPVVKVEGATEISVRYSWEDEVTSYPVSDSGIVVLDAVTANALYANISLTANGETVVWSVASFVNAIMESDLPTAEQKTLAQAMALYMDAVHTYAGMKK